MSIQNRLFWREANILILQLQLQLKITKECRREPLHAITGWSYNKIISDLFRNSSRLVPGRVLFHQESAARYDSYHMKLLAGLLTLQGVAAENCTALCDGGFYQVKKREAKRVKIFRIVILNIISGLVFIANTILKLLIWCLFFQ